MDLWIRKEGENVDEFDTGDREVIEMAESRAEFYLKTGEGGGAGGGSGDPC